MRADGKNAARYTHYNYKYSSGNLAAGGKEYAGRILLSLAKKYQVLNHKIMDEYWQQEVLKFIPIWKEAIEVADTMKAKNPLKSGDAPNMDFSLNFEERLAASGHPTGFDTMEDEKKN